VNYTKEVNFIKSYLEISYNEFLDSLLRQIELGRTLSSKQLLALHKFMNKTNLEELKTLEEDRAKKFCYILTLFERLQKVRFGARLKSESMCYSIYSQFKKKGYLSDKQIAFLEKMVHMFRRQWS